MSPEQARGLELDRPTDLWSLGVVFYELLTGKNPFLSDTTTDTVAAILKSEPASLRSMAPGSAEDAQPIISKLIAKTTVDRYQDALSLIDDLQSLSERLKYPKSSSKSHESIIETNLLVETSSVGPPRQQSTKRLDNPGYALSIIKPTKLRLAVLVLLLITTLVLVRYARFSTPQISASPITSVAVLPFANENGDINSQYISDGLSESLIERLSRLSRMKVIARESSFKFRDSSAEMKEVAKDLAVQAIVTGKVLRQGDDVQVDVQLLDPNQKKQLWTGIYHYKTSELALFLNDASRKIAINLNPHISNDDLNLLTKGSKGEGDAYEWYLKGRFYWNQLTEEGLDKSIECFNQALTIDPENALAYSGLANSYITLGAAFRSSEDVFSKAEFNAEKAVALDGSLAEAHYAMAVTRYIYHWDLAEAEKELRRSLELNPNFALADSLLSSVSLTRGDLTLATGYINRALELDPFSLLFTSRLSYIYYCQRDTEKQVKLIQTFLNRDPSASILYDDLAIAYSQMGKFNDGLAASQRAMVLVGQDPDTLSTLGVVYALGGKVEEARWVANSLKELSNKRYVPPYLVARVYSALGDKDQAFRWLDKAVQQHDSYILRVKVEWVLNDLRTDERYNTLIESLNVN